jgi:lipopolysaccharide/colanic/teichoic acid biosynthesis glycosyltransferase
VLPVADLLGVFAAAAIAGAGPARGAAYGVAVLIAAAAAGLYRRHIGQRVGDQAGRLAAVAVLPVLVLLPWTAAGQALLLAGCAAGLVVAARTAACAGLRAARRRGRLTGQALIIGSGPAAAQLARLLRAHPELGLNPCGRLDNQPARVAGLAVLGPLRAAPAVLDHFDIAQVLVCWPAATEAELTAALRACRASGARVSVLPRLPELGAAVPRACLDDIWGVPLIPLRPDPLGPARLASKRAIDLSAGAVLFALTAPLMAALALAVRLDLRLPPLFRQVRVVGRGRRATITKLRTLRPDGDPDTTWVVPEGQCSALGRLLRGTHADELPQLASVLRGDMSLVGPRPERPHFARQLAEEIPGYAGRERVTAGLTGWAQVHGLTGDTSIEDRVRFDNSYIEYGSAWLDLLILARTVPSALAGALHPTRGGTS